MVAASVALFSAEPRSLTLDLSLMLGSRAQDEQEEMQ